MGRFGRYSCLFVSLTLMLKVKFIIHLVMHVMVKHDMLQTWWFHALIYIGLYRHLVNHTLDSYLSLDLYRSSFIMSNWHFGLKLWGFIKSLPWADIDPKWPSPFTLQSDQVWACSKRKIHLRELSLFNRKWGVCLWSWVVLYTWQKCYTPVSIGPALHISQGSPLHISDDKSTM